MDLKEIASVTGKPGLFKIVKPTRNGVILESIDQQKLKTVINTNSKVSILKDVSIYTQGAENSKSLSEIFMILFKKYGANLPVQSKADDAQLKKFFLEVLPEYDTERVYVSDIRKVINWYTIVLQHYPELFQEKVTSEETILEAEEVVTEKKTTKKTSKSGQELLPTADGSEEKKSKTSEKSEVLPAEKKTKSAKTSSPKESPAKPKKGAAK